MWRRPLRDPAFRLTNAFGLRQLKPLIQRLRLVKDIGAPPMRLLPYCELENMGIIPHSDDKLTVDALQVMGGPPPANRIPIYVFFVSHRWVPHEAGEEKPTFPDTLDHQKTRQIISAAGKRVLAFEHTNSFWTNCRSHDAARAAQEPDFLLD